MNEELFKATNCLHAGQVKTTTTKRDLWNFFGEFARVKNIRINTVPAAALIPRFLNSNILSVLLFVNPKLCTIIDDCMNYLL